MATYYNMNESNTAQDCTQCPAPVRRWDSRAELWKYWLLDPQTEAGVDPGVMSAGVGQMTVQGCGCKNGTAGCCDGAGWPAHCHEDHFPAQPGQHCGLVDKAHAGDDWNDCHALPAHSGECFFWTQPDLEAGRGLSGHSAASALGRIECRSGFSR